MLIRFRSKYRRGGLFNSLDESASSPKPDVVCPTFDPIHSSAFLCLGCVHQKTKQLKASLAEQLSVDQLRIEFRRYVKTKVAQELVDFYLDSLKREEVTGFFERQVRHSVIRGHIRPSPDFQRRYSSNCRILCRTPTLVNAFVHQRYKQ